MSIVCEDVHKVYESGGYYTPALRGISLHIEAGEFVCIMGPSGSGKSTLLNLIGALDRPTKGRIFIDGVDLSELDDYALAELRNQKIGFIFQTFNLIQRMSALENVEVPLLIRGISDREIRERAKRILGWVGLAHRMHHTPDRMSGGEQQRVAIARALITQPKIILGDEPTGNIDSKATHSIMRLLKYLNEKLKITMVIVTHNMEVAAYAQRVFHIRDGRIERIVTHNGKNA
ncbi:MAG: ABC transporter ATP-binding protein [Nitrososphaerota archaeon]|nr:ABC transporter ATP-binding protein [Nitrososphaerales archaeon]MDW8045125.1 ABC transporter ATP-binding protein [Nitrososphaerota archaeon]